MAARPLRILAASRGAAVQGRNRSCRFELLFWLPRQLSSASRVSRLLLQKLLPAPQRGRLGFTIITIITTLFIIVGRCVISIR